MKKKVMTPAQIRKIKDVNARDKADKAYDKAKGIKQGSKKDVALDKKNGVFTKEYGKGGKKLKESKEY